MARPFRPVLLSLRGGLALGALTLGVAGVIAYGVHARAMPGESFAGRAPRPSADERRLAAELRSDIDALVAIGERSERRPEALTRARDRVEERLRGSGLEPQRHRYAIDGTMFDNVFADVLPRDGTRDGPHVLLGAHYDSARGSPGGNDDGSGVAVVLALAARLAADPPEARVRLALFVNEEPPRFATADMGSRRYAAEVERPRAAVVLDSLGYYDPREGSQSFPVAQLAWAFPDRGDFVAFVGDALSADLLRQAIGAFRSGTPVPSEGVVLSRGTMGAAWSDHASFWEHDVPAILLTDTAAFRDTRYHHADDDGSQVDALALARIALGIERVMRCLAGPDVVGAPPRP